ncbi:MAG: serine--tRNA ligase, partial [Candidatus Nealsonbacteria bacterium]|nr:serine--tRNA ligase [Candidatus Nealsonbacteria bacterium]
MLDRKFILENAETVKQNCINRGVNVDVDRFVELETGRKAVLTEVEDLNRQANQVSKSIGKAKDEAEREARKEEGRRLREQTSTRQAELDALTAEIGDICRMIPNMSHPAAPIGVDDKANLELFLGETPRPDFDFEPLDHVELAEKLDLVDFEGGARVAGHGFYFLRNELVLLELAMQRYALEVLMGEGFTPTTTPDLARNEILEGVGFIPRGPETQIYSIENSDLSLVATAEITLGGLYSGMTFDAEQLPIKLCGIS